MEDIFERDIYVSIVNEALGLQGTDVLTVTKLDANASGATRLLKQTENACKLLSPTAPEFDHYSPSDWLVRNPQLLDGEAQSISNTLDRAEKIFKAVNAKLPAAA